MILFWLLAGLLASGAAFLILFRAAAAERRAAAGDPTLEVYRRQLGEIDELAERGLLGPEEHRAARAEAARRLLGHADQARAATPAPPSSRGVRTIVLAGAVLAPLAALAVYLMIGSPGLPDQPFKARMTQWRKAAQTDPSRLALPELAAVLEQFAAQRPRDPQPLAFLGRIQAAQGDAAAAARSLQKAAALAPNDAQTWSALGEVRVEAADGQLTEDARRAFLRAQALDPRAPAPRYFLSKAAIEAGRLDEGLAGWRSLAADLPPGDAGRGALQAQIDQVVRTGSLKSAAPPQEAKAETGEQAAFIQSMVDRLAARLKAQPDDPAGWARLIRSYGVLGQAANRDAAIAEARRRFKDRPRDLQTALGSGG